MIRRLLFHDASTKVRFFQRCDERCVVVKAILHRNGGCFTCVINLDGLYTRHSIEGGIHLGWTPRASRHARKVETNVTIGCCRLRPVLCFATPEGEQSGKEQETAPLPAISQKFHQLLLKKVL